MPTRVLLALCAWFALAACSSPPADPQFEPTATFELSRDEAGQLCTADGACYPNPCGCAAAEVAIDAATGETRETCIDEAGASDASCQGLAACVRVTAPEPDCVVCAWIGGRVFYSTCQPDDGIVCEIVDRWRSGVSIGGAEPPDPDASGDRAASYDPCAAGGTFRTDDGCNTCHCDAEGNIVCTEMACLGCTPGETFAAPDGCNTCFCAEDGTFACTEMACNATCKVCRDATGRVVYEECGDDCSSAVCPQIRCAPGYLPTRVPGSCCETCVPVDECRDVACPAIAPIECPPGYELVRDPDDCCGTRCQPTDCSMVACPAVEIACPDGYRVVSGPPGCCPRCEPAPNCITDADCADGEVCSTRWGDCRSACGTDGPCLTACMGLCTPDVCLLDFVCSDGSLPQGPECWCPGDGTCPLDFVCADGSLPQGPECRCPEECLLPYVCADGSTPQGRECTCPGEPGDVCYGDQDCKEGLTCSVSRGDCRPPPGCGPDMVCPAVCTGVCE